MNGLRVEVKVQGENGLALYNAAKNDLFVWGGMDHSTGLDEDGYGSCSFDLNTVQLTAGDSGPRQERRIATLINWLEGFGVDYSVTLHRWRE